MIIAGEVIDSLMLMGETDNHLVVNNKLREIVRRRSKDGSWVGDDPDDVEHFHSTYNSMNGLVYHDEKWLQSGLGNSTVPSEDYRLDPQDLDAAFRNLRLIPVNTAGKTANGQQWERDAASSNGGEGATGSIGGEDAAGTPSAEPTAEPNNSGEEDTTGNSGEEDAAVSSGEEDTTGARGSDVLQELEQQRITGVGSVEEGNTQEGVS